MRSIDNVSDRGSTELTEDTAVLLEDVQGKKLNEKGRAHVRANYREVLQSFDSRKLEYIISKLYLNKSTQEILAHPSHGLVAQLCLDFLGFDQTKVDSKIGPKSKEAILLLKGIYNRMLYKNIPLTGQVDTDFFVAAQRMLQSNFVYDIKDTKTQQLIAEVKKDQQFAEIRYEKGMIMNWKHNPQKFMREVGTKPLDPAFVGKIFYIGTKNRKDISSKKVTQKKHLFWHGSAGGSAATLQELYRSANTAYAILENGAIVCFYDEGKGTGALNGNKGNIFGDPAAHSNGIAVEFAARTTKKTVRITRKGKTWTENYTDTVEPNQQQITASQYLLNNLEKKNGHLNVGTSGAGWVVGSSDHTDTIGRSNETLRKLGVDESYIQEMHQFVNGVDEASNDV